MQSKLFVLLVEDDPAACKEIVTGIDNDPDNFFLIGITNNSARAIEYVINDRPDAVILDLELHQGGGDGLEFLKQLNVNQPERRPFILITTNNISAITHEVARELGADYIMTKSQEGYCAQYVLDFLKITKTVILNRRAHFDVANSDANDTVYARRLQQKICNELDKVGISPKSIGYQYLKEAITTTIKEPVQHICFEIGVRYKKSENSVERAMQNAINRAWTTSDTKELLKHYTAKIKTDRGVPTITEFIFYYAQKIKNEL